VFLLPNGFLNGGATGIAILLSELFDFDISLFLLIVSVPFLILAWFSLSKIIFIKSGISIVSLAVIIHFKNFEAVTEDKFLIAIFGGLFLGAGIGLTIRKGAVLDGSEILVIFINNRLVISIGKVILLFNTILFGTTALLLSLAVVMYSILTFIVTAKFIDLIIKGLEDYVGLMIVSKKINEIDKSLIKVVDTGTTLYQGSGSFGKEVLNLKIIRFISLTQEVDDLSNMLHRIYSITIDSSASTTGNIKLELDDTINTAKGYKLCLNIIPSLFLEARHLVFFMACNRYYN
jgi:uncharacterized membrane-anchored protein YitT (DUF2179 family)